MKKLLLSALVALLSSPGIAFAQSSSDDWEFALTPFLWGSGLSGTVGIAGRSADFEVSVEDLLESLDFGLMGNFEARKGRWSIGTDLVYTDLGKDVTFANAPGISDSQNPRLDMSMTIIEADVGYQFAQSVDVLAGVRGVSSSASLRIDAGTLAEADASFVDPIVGLRFRRNLSEKFWVNLRGDVGGFGVGSDFSWFVNADAGYRVSRLISLDFGYRIWDFDYESDGDLKKLDAALAGFGFGLTFHF
jgi:Outer membrane protein beta-barrel domain